MNIIDNIMTLADEYGKSRVSRDRITLQNAIEQALKPVQEPVGYMHCPSHAMQGRVRPVLSFEKYEDDYASGIYANRIPLYTSPHPQREWVGLTDTERAAVQFESFKRGLTPLEFMKLHEDKLKEKNT
jgi:hypothetical protein